MGAKEGVKRKGLLLLSGGGREEGGAEREG